MYVQRLGRGDSEVSLRTPYNALVIRILPRESIEPSKRLAFDSDEAGRPQLFMLSKRAGRWTQPQIYEGRGVLAQWQARGTATSGLSIYAAPHIGKPHTNDAWVNVASPESTTR